MDTHIDAAERKEHGTCEDKKAGGDAEATAREGGDEAAGTKTYANEWLQERNEFRVNETRLEGAMA